MNKDQERISAKKLASQFATINKTLRDNRKQAKRTLSPTQILQGIKRGEVSPEMAMLIGTRPDGKAFDVEDLKKFVKSRNKAEKKHGKSQGVTIDQLLAASRDTDIARANGTFKPEAPNTWVGNLSRGSARLYRINGAILTFVVKASGDSVADQYQVRIRATEWESQTTNARANPRTAVINAFKGPVQIDCNCPRHQYWYRYLAGVGKYAITPPAEKDFPKVRNPDLTGTVCKHTVAVFQSVRTPTYVAMLAKKMEEQRSKIGFGSSNTTKDLTRAEIDALGRSRPRKTDQAKYIKKIETAVKKAISSKKEGAKLRAEVGKLKARKRTLEKQVAAEEMRLEKARSKIRNKPKDDAKEALSAMLRTISKEQNISESEAAAFMMAQLGARNKDDG